MSKLNLTRRTFLEKEELARFQQFLADSPSENAIIGNTSKWGILRTDFATDTDFLVEPSANAGRVKIDKTVNKALISTGLRAVQNAIDNIAITDDSAWYWLRIKHKYVNWESGVVSVNASGELTGVGTAFTSILRGQGTQVPVRIKFAKEDGSSVTNSGFYEVVDITSDSVAILTSAIEFQAETDLKMVVIGTTPIGESVTIEQEDGLYNYDSCEIEIVAEDVLDTPPTTGFVQDQTFYIARVQNTGGFVVVQDKRIEWWEFNVVGLTDKLSIYNNLSDLTNADTALTNLGITTVGKNLSKLDASPTAVYLKVLANGTISKLTPEQVYNDLVTQMQGSFLQKTSNLSDLSDKPAARTNLDVYNKAESLALLNTERIDLSSALEPGYELGENRYAYLLKNNKVVTLLYAITLNNPSNSQVLSIPENCRPSGYIRPIPYVLIEVISSYPFGRLSPTGILTTAGIHTTGLIIGTATWVIE